MTKPNTYGTVVKNSGLIYDNSSTLANPGGDGVIARHLISAEGGLPTITNKGANVTSVTPVGNNVRGGATIVMAGGLAANTRICTVTFSLVYAVAPFIFLINQTSGTGLANVNFYYANRGAASFDLLSDQALVLGTYILAWFIIG